MERATSLPRYKAGDGYKFTGLASSLDFPLGTCIVMDDVGFHTSSIEWNSMRLRVHKTMSSPRRCPQKKPAIPEHGTGCVDREALRVMHALSVILRDICWAKKQAFVQLRLML